MDGPTKLQKLRELMKERKFDAYIIPHGDQHDNEFIDEADERIKFISNFSGSNGVGLVTQDVALMWTDGRYYIQIEKELYPGWQMQKMERGTGIIDYIQSKLPKGICIGMDFHLFTEESISEYTEGLSHYKFKDDEENLIDLVWGKDKPKYKDDKVIIHPEKYTGKSVKEKIDAVSKILVMSVQAPKDSTNDIIYRLLISRLDDIAWLLNLRGSDIPYNPVFFAYAILYVTPKGNYVHLFANKKKFDSPEIQEHLSKFNISLFDYDDINKELSSSEPNVITISDKESTNFRMMNLMCFNKKNFFFPLEESIVTNIKSVKNKVELQGLHNSNLKDCVALIRFFSWLEDELVNKKRTDLNEYEIGLKSKFFREQQELFMGESFAPICGSGSNAAIIHYEQNENLHSDMSIDKILLCDTGGQYMDGTTDITRTLHFGKPKKEEMEMYTRVLLGNLSLERMQFKRGSKLSKLDAIARMFLLEVGKDYKHGTSHGVGFFLNVHEGPYDHPLKVGNFLTNEPGYYERDAFGIRIENDLIVVEKENDLLGFENITILPYEKNLIDLSLISEEMKSYLNAFHKKVFDTLSPFVKDEEKVLDYLKRKTDPI